MTDFVVILSTFLVFYGLMTLKQSVTAISPYDSGYNHGYDDAKAGGHPYLDIPGNGQEFHTPEFMQQYNDGYNDCSPPRSNHQFINPCGGGSTQEYCRGYHDGAVQVDNEDEARGAGSPIGLGFHGCPYDSTPEYCKGYERGYNDEIRLYM